MKPLTARLMRAADALLVHSEYIGVVHGPDLRPLRLAGRGTARNTVSLCLWATHNIVEANVPLSSVLLSPETVTRLEGVASQQLAR